MIGEHFPTGPAWRHHGRMPAILAGLRMTDGNDCFDLAVSFEQRAPESNRLGADREPTDRGAEMQPGEDASFAVAHRGSQAMAVRMKMLPERCERCLDQGAILGCKWQSRRKWFSQPPRPPHRPPR